MRERKRSWRLKQPVNSLLNLIFNNQVERKLKTTSIGKFHLCRTIIDLQNRLMQINSCKKCKNWGEKKKLNLCFKEQRVKTSFHKRWAHLGLSKWSPLHQWIVENMQQSERSFQDLSNYTSFPSDTWPEIGRMVSKASVRLARPTDHWVDLLYLHGTPFISKTS